MVEIIDDREQSRCTANAVGPLPRDLDVAAYGHPRRQPLASLPVGRPKIALTPARSVADYFACNAVNGDRHDHPDDESDPVVLTIDGEYLYDLLYDLGSYSDPVWGDGECHWENEIACWDNIAPLDEVLIGVTPVPKDRWRAFCEAATAEHRKELFKAGAASVAPVT